MRIRGWSIDGFGHFRDRDVTGIGDGLTVFHGPNEAGKSTLLAFIRGMLFGFPDRRSREPRYEPLHGGRHGGRLFLDVDGEPWTLERDASRGSAGVRVTAPRGEVGEDELRHALGSADTRLFRSVFAFSLTELQSFNTLSEEGARSRIFSAGIVGAGRAARQVIGELGEQADALFRPRGRTQVIPTLLRQLAERRQATMHARRATRGYAELVREEDACLAAKQRLDGALVSARSEARRHEGLLSLWGVWQDLREAEVQHAALEAVDAFPADAERRLAELGLRRETARTRVLEARTELEQAEGTVAAEDAHIRPALESLAPEVAAHHESRERYRDLVTRLQAARVDIAHADEALDRALRALGGDWDEDRLAVFDVSLPQRDRIRAWSDQLRRADDDVRGAERDHLAATRILQHAERDVARAADDLGAAPTPDPERVEAIGAALRRLRAQLAERREREQSVAQQRTVLAERERTLRLLESQAEPEPEPASAPASARDRPADAAGAAGATAAAGREPPRRADDASAGSPAGHAAAWPVIWLIPLGIALTGLAIAGALVFTVSTRPWLGITTGLLAIALGIASAVVLRTARAASARATEAERRAAAERLTAVERAIAAERQAAAERVAAAEHGAAERRRAHAARVQSAADLVAEAREAVERAQREAGSVNAVLAAEIATLGWSGTPTPADLEERERALAQQRQAVSRAEQLQRVRSEAEARRTGALDQVATAARAVAQARASAEAARQAWGAWASTRGIPGEMSPESALDFVPAVQQARDLQHARTKRRASADTLAAAAESWERHARQLLARAPEHVDAIEPGELTEALHVLHARCVAACAARERRTVAEVQARSVRARLDILDAEWRRREAEWSALLEEGGAQDEAQYRSRLQTFTDRQRLRRDVDRLRRQLTDRIGEGPDAAATRATLAGGDVARWERERDRHQTDVAVLEQQLEQAITTHHDAKRRREELEASADIPGCEAEEQAILTELDAAVTRWRTIALARALTETTLQEYVRTRQPAVVAHASGMFATVTEGAYTDLRQDESGEGLSIVTRRGQVLGPDQLSRGTAEQLYLCLRLGLAAEFGVHGAQLPLVMDDVCVNFDPDRARAIAAVLRDYAAGQQIIFFTCHPTTVELLRATVPALHVQEMPRFGAEVVLREPGAPRAVDQRGGEPRPAA
jgi:uncharacterized protein YhaN